MLFSGDHQGTDLPKVEHSSPTPSVHSTASSLSTRATYSWADVTDDNSSDDQISSSSRTTSDFLPQISSFTAFESLFESEEAKQPLSPLTAGALLSYESEQSAKIPSSTSIDGAYGGSDSSRRKDLASAAQLLACRTRTKAALTVMKGDQRLIAALIAKLQHESSNVKKAALVFLGELTEVGDHNVVTEVCACLEHHVTSASVTTAAVATLCTLALQGDQEHIVTSLTSLVGHKSKNVRKVAIQSLVKLSEQGIAISVSAISACTADTESEVRIATLKAITKFAAKGDQEALFAVSDCLGDPQHEVRIASLKAIAQIAVKGNQDAMMAVSLSVADTDSGVRLAALCAIAEIADKGDENAFAYSQLLGRPRRKFGGAASSGGVECTPGGGTSSSGVSLPGTSGTSHSADEIYNWSTKPRSTEAEHSCTMQ